MNDLQEQLLIAFQAEHREHLEGMRSLLAEAEKGGAVDLEEAFRQAHSLKAAARVCDLGPIETLGQRLEMLFARVRRGSLALDKQVLGVVHLVMDSIENWARCLAEKRTLPDLGGTTQAIDKLVGNGGERKSSSPVPETAAPKTAPREAPPQAGLPSDLSQQLLEAFQIEHKEHLEGIRSILGEIERGEPAKGARTDEAFRRAHSLKGAARLAELKGAEIIAHRLETLFAKVREGGLDLNQEVIRVIYQGLDSIEDWAASLLENRPAPESAPALEAIERVLGGRAPEPAPPPENAALVEAAPQQGALYQAVETVRVSADNLDRLLRSTGQLLTESLRQNLVARELTSLSRQIHDIEKEWDSLRNVAANSLRQLGETPGLSRVARYVNFVEHQVRSLARQARSVRLLHQRSAWTLRLLGGQLQQDVRRVRMVSAESVFQGFRKMMRDLARGEGKEIEFRVSGFEILADRMVLQAMKDPLMHILCNAVSHGVETPDERQRQGKNIVGRVSLHMEALGNRLKIVVEDDGRGIDHEKVAEIAVKRGFLSQEEVDSNSPEELARLIFKPGFSTSRVVTGLSGRGMGLSVVYEAVTRLQGEVDMQPKEGPGTLLVLSVPLSISTQRLLLVSCQDQTFGIPIHGIERLLRVKVQELEMVEGKPMLLLEGQPVPIMTLAYLLSMDHGDIDVAGEVLPLMVLRSGGKRVAVAVNAFLEERDALIKDLDHPAGLISRLAGGILLADGSVCLVLNLAELIKTFKPTDKAPVLKPVAAAPEKKQQSTVLVVDDSLTTRTLEKSILEAHGYNVRIAMDGVEALAQLHTEKPDLVITDIQMPRMDGFTLLEEMKKDQRLSHIPVIVVTSMEKREDQERGLALGADAYIVKRKFDHQDLLHTIRQIL